MSRAAAAAPLSANRPERASANARRGAQKPPAVPSAASHGRSGHFTLGTVCCVLGGYMYTSHMRLHVQRKCLQTGSTLGHAIHLNMLACRHFRVFGFASRRPLRYIHLGWVQLVRITTCLLAGILASPSGERSAGRSGTHIWSGVTHRYTNTCVQVQPLPRAQLRLTQQPGQTAQVGAP